MTVPRCWIDERLPTGSRSSIHPAIPRVVHPLVPQPADVAHRDVGRQERQHRFAHGGRDGEIGVVERVAVRNIEGDRPAPLHAGRPVVADRHRIEIQHLDTLGDAPFGRQVHLDMVDSEMPNSINLAGVSFGVTFSGRIWGKNKTS